LEKWEIGKRIFGIQRKEALPETFKSVIILSGNVVPSKPVPGNSARRLLHAHQNGGHNNSAAAVGRLKNGMCKIPFHCYAK
jgi:hypothetical protein